VPGFWALPQPMDRSLCLSRVGLCAVMLILMTVSLDSGILVCDPLSSLPAA
jgi:hypothetical protein